MCSIQPRDAHLSRCLIQGMNESEAKKSVPAAAFEAEKKGEADR